MRIQRGYLFKASGWWYGRWYQKKIENGVVVNRQHCEKLCEVSERYRTKSDVQPLLDAKLRAINERRAMPEGTLTVASYVESRFLPYADAELKPSTVNGYRQIWRMYLKPRVADVVLRDFRCKDATDVLKALFLDHGLSSITLRHVKWFLSSVFMHAKRVGAIDIINPVEDAGIPRAAKKGHKTHAYSSQEISTMLNTLNGVGRAAVAVMFFGGLRPGEARAIQWSDYDEKRKLLQVRSSMWRSHLTAPKTEESAAAVPVAQALADILAELPRVSNFILTGPSGRPMDLHNLAGRVVKPGLDLCVTYHQMKSNHEEADHKFERDNSIPVWRGWYACRRGLATVATSVDSPMAAKSLLRHSNIQTTAQHYIKSVSDDAVRAVDKIDALFDNNPGVPN